VPYCYLSISSFFVYVEEVKNNPDVKQLFFFWIWLAVTFHGCSIVMGLPIKNTISNLAREADRIAFLSSKQV
jgi:hypothetical protein